MLETAGDETIHNRVSAAIEYRWESRITEYSKVILSQMDAKNTGHEG